MTAATLTLTDFLLDRLAELELAAQIALATAPSEPIEGITPAGAVWFTPEQVLADVKAKRRVIEIHEHWAAGSDIGCITCHWDADAQEASPSGLCETIRALAAAYADHPDFDKEWKP